MEPLADVLLAFATSVACRPGFEMVDRPPPGSEERWYHALPALAFIALFVGAIALINALL